MGGFVKMSKIALIPTVDENNDSRGEHWVEKRYTMEGTKINGLISPCAVAPLRILGHILNYKNLYCEITQNGNNPWDITQILIDDKDAAFVKKVLEEIMQYRCAFELGVKSETIIRQLPFFVAMQTSNDIIPFLIPESERRLYEELVNNREHYFHVEQLQEIPEDQYVLGKHLIYPSSRGGYNIKTNGYNNPWLDHYCASNSNTWD